MRSLVRAVGFLAVLAAAALSSQAQNLGSVTIGTAQQKIFAAQTVAAVSPNTSSFPCTPVNGTPCAIPNAGQAGHMVTYVVASPCVGAFGLDIRLEASFDGTNFFAISEDAVDQPNSSLQGSQLTGGLTATGYYPVIRLNLVKFSCGSGTPTLTAFYSGTSAVTPTPAGVFGQALPYRKVIVENVDTTTASPSVTVTVPTGNASGVVYVQCLVPATGAPIACPANGGFQVIGSVADSGNALLSLQSTTVAAASTLQQFTVGSFLTNRVSFTITPTGGGGGTNWSIYYQLNPQPGNPATGTNAPQVQVTGADPCSSSAVNKSSAVLTAGAAATTQIVGLVAGQVIFVCGYQMSQAATAGTLQWVQGTGANCGTGTANLTGAMTVTANQPIAYGGGDQTVMRTAAGNALCLTTTGAGGTAAGVVTFVQQ